MSWNTNTSYSTSYPPTNLDFEGIGNDLRLHGGDVNVAGYALQNIGSWTSSNQPHGLMNASGSGYTIPDRTWTPIQMSTTVTLVGFTTVTGFLVIPVTGVYQLGGAVRFAANLNGSREAQYWNVTSGLALPYAAIGWNAGAVDDTIVALPSPQVTLTAGTKIAVAGYHSAGMSLTTPSGSAGLYAFISALQLK